MIFSQSLRILLAVTSCDLHKSFDSPGAVVRNELRQDPLSGQPFVFLNRAADPSNTAGQPMHDDLTPVWAAPRSVFTEGNPAFSRVPGPRPLHLFILGKRANRCMV